MVVIWVVWTACGKFQPETPTYPTAKPIKSINPRFGKTMAISGQTLAIAGDNGIEIFSKEDHRWVLQRVLYQAHEAKPFDLNLAISPNEKLIAVGDFAKGEVSLYCRNTESDWKLLENLSREGWFGHDLALSDQLLAIGIPLSPSRDGKNKHVGSVAVFKLHPPHQSCSEMSSPNLLYTTHPPEDLEQEGLQFGRAVDLTADNQLTVSAILNHGDTTALFSRDASVWIGAEPHPISLPVATYEKTKHGRVGYVARNQSTIAVTVTNKHKTFVQLLRKRGAVWQFEAEFPAPPNVWLQGPTELTGDFLFSRGKDSRIVAFTGKVNPYYRNRNELYRQNNGVYRLNVATGQWALYRQPNGGRCGMCKSFAVEKDTLIASPKLGIVAVYNNVQSSTVIDNPNFILTR